MSKTIKITVVMDVEKTDTEEAIKAAENKILTYDTSMTLMSFLLENRLMDGSFCGGRGDCGRCLVRFLEGAPLPTGVERARLTPEELRRGYRLACMSRPKGDCAVEIVGVKERDVPIVTEVILPSDGVDSGSHEKNLTENQATPVAKFEADAISGSEKAIKKTTDISKKRANVIECFGKQEKPETKENGCYIITVDLGTTTIAMQLRELETGKAVETYCERNPQRIYGTDVLSRIQAANAGHGEELRRLVCETLMRGVRQFVECVQKREAVRGPVRDPACDLVCGPAEETEAGHDQIGIACMCIAGNTVMEHLLLGYDVEAMGRAPFVPVETGLQELPFARLFLDDLENFENFEKTDFLKEAGDVLRRLAGVPVYIAPCVSAFVGGDIVAGLYALRMFSVSVGHGAACGDAAETAAGQSDEKEDRKRDEKKDESKAGSRAFMLIDLGTNGEMVITDGKRMIATATAAGPAFEGDGILIGTDRIALTAELLQRGILDETGLFAEPYFTEGVCLKENNCYFKQSDVRSLQMAKAAVRAGVEILWEEMGRPAVERVYLAGGFGYYLDVEAAFRIGLLPARMRGKVFATGNTSLEGAYVLGHDLCTGRFSAAMLEKKLSSVKTINLANRERFEGLYVKYMNLEGN